MSVFTDYAAKMRQVRTPFSSPAGEPQGALMNQRENPLEVHGGQSVPMIDSGNALASLAAMMGPTPAEREAAERRMQKNQAQMAMWTGLADGLRQLGNLYYASKGAVPLQFNDPQQQVQQQYQQQRQLYNDMANYRRQYATSLYSLQRQMEGDRRAKEAHQTQMNYTKAREEALRDESRRKDEYNEARTKYYEAVANKNDEQAEYWRLRAQGVPKESAAKIAKDYALAAKANRTDGSGRNNGTYGYKTTTYIDEQGRKVTERVPTTGGKAETTVHEPKLPKQAPQEPKQPKQAAVVQQPKGRKGTKGSIDQSKLKGLSIHNK